MTGPPASGKTTLVEALVRRLRADGRAATGAPMDGFHLPNAELAARGLTDHKGEPATFDAEAFVAKVRELAEGKRVSWPEYSRVLHEPVPDAVTVDPSATVVLVEGNYLLLDDEPWRQLRPLLDEVWFVEADLDSIEGRLRARHLEGGRSPEETERHIRESNLANARLVLGTRHRADLRVRIDPGDPELSDLTDPATGRRISLDS
ncbi:MAG: nucleoside triphosphate hydrolase [Thermoleophilaceae bacterium]